MAPSFSFFLLLLNMIRLLPMAIEDLGLTETCGELQTCTWASEFGEDAIGKAGLYELYLMLTYLLCCCQSVLSYRDATELFLLLWA